jgi:predicted transglutaminase-like cysteine proteinase
VLAKRDAQLNPELAVESAQLRGTVAAVNTAPIVSRSAGPFEDRGYILFGSHRGSIASKWADIQARWTTEQRQLDDCLSKRGPCTSAMRLYNRIARQASSLNDDERIAYVNVRVNHAVRYQDDMQGHGMSDVWTSPLRTLAGAGDCEDYAIAKFYLLLASGVSIDRMRIVLVRDNRAGEDHAVLAVKTEAGWSVLDNRWNEIHVSRDLEHYTPVAALGSELVQIYAASFAADPEMVAYSAPSSGW